MSGVGGYYKYRCKYWLTYNCSKWVWVNRAACADCLSYGRDDDYLHIDELVNHCLRSRLYEEYLSGKEKATAAETKTFGVKELGSGSEEVDVKKAIRGG